MTQEEAIVRLSRYQSDEPSDWRVEEEKIRHAKSKGWLQYSRKIAIKVAVAMKQQGLSRQDVADRMLASIHFQVVERNGKSLPGNYLQVRRRAEHCHLAV